MWKQYDPLDFRNLRTQTILKVLPFIVLILHVFVETLSSSLINIEKKL